MIPELVPKNFPRVLSDGAVAEAGMAAAVREGAHDKMPIRFGTDGTTLSRRAIAMTACGRCDVCWDGKKSCIKPTLQPGSATKGAGAAMGMTKMGERTGWMVAVSGDKPTIPRIGSLPVVTPHLKGKEIYVRRLIICTVN